MILKEIIIKKIIYFILKVQKTKYNKKEISIISLFYYEKHIH